MKNFGKEKPMKNFGKDIDFGKDEKPWQRKHC
jgi:hypothetical protein